MVGLEEFKKNSVDMDKKNDKLNILDGKCMNDSESNIILSSGLKTQRKSIINSSRVFFLLMLASLFLLFSCEREDMFSVSLDAMTYLIGDTGPGGGIVFYITDGGFHGMEVAPSGWNGGSDPTSTWSNLSVTPIGVTAQGTMIGTGQLNTNAIISQPGHTSSAAKLCRDYTGGGKSDWFLPSQDELNAIWVNIVNAGYPNGVGGYTSNTYWSSSEDPANASDYAFILNFTSGITGAINAKGSNIFVRPVRKF